MKAQVLLLAGGVGGAKLAAGLAQLLPPQQLTIIVNSGDDFQHLGLTICPDFDTVMYTLAGVANPKTGWGVAGESWHTLATLQKLGAPDWFQLGDKDLATHLWRTHLQQQSLSLTAANQRLSQAWGVGPTLLPMSDEPAPTKIVCAEGVLDFQTWFVHRGWQPAVEAVQLPPDLKASAEVCRAIHQADIVILAPSNPFVSIDPILNSYPVEAMITDLAEVVIAVSPIIGGQAVKGPAAKMMAELGLPVSSRTVAEKYAHLLTAFVYDIEDEALWAAEPMPELTTLGTQTMMYTAADQRRLASDLLTLAATQLGAT